MEDVNKASETNNVNKKSDEAFVEEAEKIVNRIFKQYDSLVDLSKKHHGEDKDINFMFNALKKYHDNTKKAFKESEKDNGFTFKK